MTDEQAECRGCEAKGAPPTLLHEVCRLTLSRERARKERDRAIDLLAEARAQNRRMSEALEMILRKTEDSRICQIARAALSDIEPTEQDGIWCPRCGEVFHDSDVQAQPELYWTCPTCFTNQHRACRGPLEDGSGT